MESLTAIADTGQAAANWNEQACVQDCVKGNIAGQELFYKHFYPTMMAVVLRYTSDADDACSILNNGFLKVFKNLKSFRNEGSLEGWVKRIVIHSVSDYFRYKHPLKEIPKDVLPENVAPFVPEHVPYDYRLLLKLLNGLPPATRTVINLFMIDGFTHKEIAKILGISENTSKWHVGEGRKLLQQKLDSVNK